MKNKNPYRSKGGKFRIPGRRLPPPSELRMSDRVVEHKKKEKIKLENVVKCEFCFEYFIKSEIQYIYDNDVNDHYWMCWGCLDEFL